MSEVLDFKLLVTYFIDLDVNFYDAINPLLIAYEYKEIKSRLSTVITSFWPQLIAERSADEVMKVIRIFYFCCEIPALLYIKKYIENLPQPTEAPYGSAYNLQNYRRDTDILALLAKFRYLEPAVVRASLELMILYIHKAPHKAEYLANLINEKYSFKRTSYLLNNALQHTLFDCLIEHIKNNQDDLICRQSFLAIVGHFLETHCRETEFLAINLKYIILLYVRLNQLNYSGISCGSNYGVYIQRIKSPSILYCCRFLFQKPTMRKIFGGAMHHLSYQSFLSILIIETFKRVKQHIII